LRVRELERDTRDGTAVRIDTDPDRVANTDCADTPKPATSTVTAARTIAAARDADRVMGRD
jgi:hypothetical protein